ncbi:hypothetical protein B0H19DRAFT_442681 [Mycena capillaripes]|nr:hypothetical protein B0H19DRAFT_442681 [Mycena capillaripes]
MPTQFAHMRVQDTTQAVSTQQRLRHTPPSSSPPSARRIHATLITHDLPHARHIPFPIAHGSVSAFSHTLAVSASRASTTRRAPPPSPAPSSLPPHAQRPSTAQSHPPHLTRALGRIPSMLYTPTGMPSHPDDCCSPLHAPRSSLPADALTFFFSDVPPAARRVCSLRLAQYPRSWLPLPTPPSSPRRLHLRPPLSTIATALSATAAPRMGSKRASRSRRHPAPAPLDGSGDVRDRRSASLPALSTHAASRAHCFPTCSTLSTTSPLSRHSLSNFDAFLYVSPLSFFALYLRLKMSFCIKNTNVHLR